MKIGIITVQRAPNYGAQLQCYALYKFLKDMGHDVEIIDLLRPYHKDFNNNTKYKPFQSISWQKRLYRWIKSKVKWLISNKYRKHLKNEHLFSLKYSSEYIQLNEKFARFESRMKYSETYHSLEELNTNTPYYDAYLTGSDQLWNPTQPYCVEPYFLTFVRNGSIKMSYATSVGLADLPNPIKNQYKEWLKSFKWISVREQSAVSILRGIGLTNVERHIDPTFLVKAEEWMQMAIKPEIDNYLFYFSISQNPHKLLSALKLAKQNNLKLVYRKKTYKQELNDTNALGLIDISPEEWLGLILYSNYVITDSFHGTAFSIIFRKNFNSFILNGSKRGSRIVDLLELLGLNNRLCNNDFSHFQMTQVDYKGVCEVIQSEANKTNEYFTRIIKYV